MINNNLNSEVCPEPTISKYTEFYAALAKERIIFISEDITKDTASLLSGMLIYYDYEDNSKDISIYINTNGGDSHAFSNIYDVMQMIKSPIKTICIGKAYSAGALILAAGTKGKRLITKHASVMTHGIQFTFPNDPTADQRESEIYFKYLKNHNHMILAILAKHTGKTIENILEDCKKDNYFDAKQALEYGIVDKII